MLAMLIIAALAIFIVFVQYLAQGRIGGLSGVWPPAWTALRCTVAGVVVYALGRAWHVAGWIVPVKLVALPITYLALLFLARELGVEDLSRLKRRLWK
jgi:hypothetical protein